MNHTTLAEIQALCASTITSKGVITLLHRLQAVSDEDILSSMILVEHFVAPTQYNQLALLLEELKQFDATNLPLDSEETDLLKQQQERLLAQRQRLIEENKATTSLREEIRELRRKIENLEQEIQHVQKELADD